MTARGSSQPILATAVVAALVLSPRRLESLPPLCVVRRLTGRRCPACGMSTSWVSLAHLRVVDAFRAHPLGPLALALAVALLARDGRLGSRFERDSFARFQPG